MLHMEPCELLAPVRQALDGMTDSARDDGRMSSFGLGAPGRRANSAVTDDGVAIDRCGTLVLFLQVVVHRFQVRRSRRLFPQASQLGLTLHSPSKLHGHLCRHLGSTTSFYAAWLRAPDAVFTLASLAEGERIAVSGWISALFGEGISDDLMQCVVICGHALTSGGSHIPSIADSQRDEPEHSAQDRPDNPEAICHGVPCGRRRSRQSARCHVILPAGAAALHPAWCPRLAHRRNPGDPVSRS